MKTPENGISLGSIFSDSRNFMSGSVYSSGAYYIFSLRERDLKYIRFFQHYTFLYFLEDD